MSKEVQTITGQAEEHLPNNQYVVRVEGGKTLRCYLTGRMIMNKIRVMVGDRVDVELPKNMDMAKISDHIGRIVYRHK